MGREIFSVTYQKVHVSKLPVFQKRLLHHAQAARRGAYAPYSDFSVGAAVELSGGEIVTGSNQENRAYPSGMCAERVALFAASAAFPEEKIIRIAVVAANEGRGIFPCGACRQVMHECEMRYGMPLEVILHDIESPMVFVFQGIDPLLPFGFSLKHTST